jgi:GAF domain-containing protein
VVPDVDAFPGHIACSSSARSEIVVPIHNASGEVVAVLDVDSSSLDQFDAIDASYLEQICSACNLF